MENKKTISPETKETVLQLKGKFGPEGITKKLIRGQKPSKEMSFTGEITEAKPEPKARRINPSTQGRNVVDLLMKIYSFMKKNYESDVMMRERENNFKEENALEDEKRHVKLIKAIDGLKSQLIEDSKLSATASLITPKPDTPTTSIFDMIADAVAMAVENLLEKFLDKLKGKPTGGLPDIDRDNKGNNKGNNRGDDKRSRRRLGGGRNLGRGTGSGLGRRLLGSVSGVLGRFTGRVGIALGVYEASEAFAELAKNMDDRNMITPKEAAWVLETASPRDIENIGSKLPGTGTGEEKLRKWITEMTPQKAEEILNNEDESEIKKYGGENLLERIIEEGPITAPMSAKDMAAFEGRPTEPATPATPTAPAAPTTPAAPVAPATPTAPVAPAAHLPGVRTANIDPTSLAGRMSARRAQESAAPQSDTNIGQALQSATQNNLNTQYANIVKPAQNSNVTNMNMSGGSNINTFPSPIPPVRNTEETIRKLIYYSTRVV